MDYCVLIPCFNAEETIVETINSVLQARMALGIEIPVYVFDDCSTDNSVRIFNSNFAEIENIFLFKNEENLGQWGTKNRAFQMFEDKHNWVFILHADDIAKENWLKSLMGKIQLANEEYFCVWSSYDCLIEPAKTVIAGDNTQLITNDFIVKKDSNYRTNISDLISNVSTSWHISGAAIQVLCWKNLGKYDEVFPHYADADIWFRAAMAGLKHIYLSETLIFYRIHDNSVSGNTYRLNRDLKETFLLAKKFEKDLNKKGRSKIAVKIVKIASKRIIKSILKLQFSNIVSLIRYAGKGGIVYLYSTFSKD